MSKSLHNQTALVTGASRGIGAAIARRLAADGAHVLVHYGQSADAADALVKEITDAGGSAVSVQGDLLDPAGPAELARETERLLGEARLDILVNNAGVAEFVDFADTDAAVIDRQLAVNVRAPFLLATGLADRFADDARVVFTSSIVAKTHFSGIPAYALTKGAVNTLVRDLAAEWGPRGIRVNAVAPGAILTDMSAWLESEEGGENARNMQALKRIGQPDDIAGVAAFLAGPDSRWVTGQVIDASGGAKL